MSAAADTAERDFRWLWAAHGISLFGSLVTRIALPFSAALALHASIAQMALLNAADLVSSLLVGPFAGAVVDRMARRPLLIGCDAMRALALASVPYAALTHQLSFAWLIAAQAICGVGNALFDAARTAYLPDVVGTDALIEANAKLQGTASVAELSAFGIAGWLVQWLTGPIAVAVDAISFVFSAFCLTAIRTPEPARVASAHTGGAAARFIAEVREGLAATFADREQRALAIADALMHVMFGTFMASYTFYCTRELALPAGPLGMIYAVGGIAGLGAAAASPRLGARMGQGSAMLLGLVIAVAGFGCALLAPAHVFAPAAALLIAQQLIGDAGLALYVIHAESRRMELAPERLRGRIAASSRFVSTGAMLLGVTAGGLLGPHSSARAVLAGGMVMLALAAATVALLRPGRARAVAEQ